MQATRGNTRGNGVARSPGRRRPTRFPAVLAVLLTMILAGSSSAAAIVDDGGPNDPNGDGQNDLTRFDVQQADDELIVQWSWDEPSAITGGGQAVNACALFDTDGDGEIDNAFCVEVIEDPSQPGQYILSPDFPAWLQCAEGKDDRCQQPQRLADPGTGDLLGSYCTVEVANTDPFPDGDDHPADLTATCHISMDLLAGAELVNLCSYPSAGNDGNNDPKDCVISPGAARLTIIKDVPSGAEQDALTTEFAFSSATASVDGETTWSRTGTGVVVEQETFEVRQQGGTITLTEDIPEGWVLESVSCVDGSGAPTGTADLATGVVSGIQLNQSVTTVCTFVNDLAVVAPVTQVIKGAVDGNDTVGPAANEPSGSFTIPVTVHNHAEPGAGDATLESLVDEPYGDITQVGGAITATTCSVPQTIVGGSSYSCEFTVTVTGQPGIYPDTVTATLSNEAAEEGITDSDQASVELLDVDAVPLSIVKSVTSAGQLLEPGGDFEFQVVVTNDSTVDTVTVSALDDTYLADLPANGTCGDQDGDTTAPFELSPAESLTCTFTVSHTGDPATFGNVVTVAALDDDGAVVGGTSNEVTVEILDDPAEIEVTKTATPDTVPETGGDVTFSFLIENLSLVDSVTITSLEDTIYGDITSIAGSTCSTPLEIAPGGDYSCSFTVTGLTGEPDAPEINVVTASGTDSDGKEVAGSDDATVSFTDALPDISVEKRADPATVAEPGENVEFTIVVTNDGLEDVTITSLTDNMFDDVPGVCAVDPIGVVLNPGGTYTCTFTKFVDGDDGDRHVNVATAKAEDNDGNGIQTGDTAEVTIVATDPVISVDKSGPATVDEGGDVATYTVKVTNDSVSTDPVTITSLVDDRFGDLLVEAEAANGGPIELAAGETFMFSFDRDLAIDGGESHLNTIEACGLDDEGTPACGDDDHEVTGGDLAPRITIDKTADPEVMVGPGPVTFTVVITNESASTDPVTIDSVKDDMHGDADGNVICRDALGDDVVGKVIEPGESITCSFVGVVDEDETDTVTVVATDDEGGEATGDDTADVDVQAPSMVVTKTADPAWIDEVGEIIVFTIAVVNDGDSDLPDPQIEDILSGGAIVGTQDLSGGVDGPHGDASGSPLPDPVFEPGDTWYYQVEYTVTQDDIDSRTDLGNVACSPDIDEDGEAECGSVTVPILIAELTIDKTTLDEDRNPARDFMVGDTVIWTYEVTNTGTVTITGIEVTDDQEGSIDCPATVLAAGESMTCEASGIAQQGPYTNIATVTGEGPRGGPDPAADDDSSSYNAEYWAFTPGFWKNHAGLQGSGRHDLWDGQLACGDTVITLDTRLDAFFAIPDEYIVRKVTGKGRRSQVVEVPLNELTLYEALSFQGGNTIDGAVETLLRAAAASMLNTCFHQTQGHDIGELDDIWPWTEHSLTAVVNAALLTGDRSIILNLAAALDADNNGIHEIDWSEW